MTRKCGCPIYCIYCGAKRKKDAVGHYCPTDNCQWRYGIRDCIKKEKAHDRHRKGPLLAAGALQRKRKGVIKMMAAGARRGGKPRTDAERRRRHKRLYGTAKLPARGTGLKREKSGSR